MLLAADTQYSAGGVEQVEHWRTSTSGFIWLDIESAPTDEIHALLESLGCDELAISDSFRLRHPPKVEAFKENTFLLFRGISTIDSTLEIAHQQIGIWVSERMLVTYHRESSVSVSYLWDHELQNMSHMSPGTLALELIHYASGLYLDTMLGFEDRLADLEDGLLSDRSEEDMKELASYRSRLTTRIVIWRFWARSRIICDGTSTIAANASIACAICTTSCAVTWWRGTSPSLRTISTRR
jgi:magnesium transporter